jgi:hypothetical protein
VAFDDENNLVNDYVLELEIRLCIVGLGSNSWSTSNGSIDILNAEGCAILSKLMR